MMFFRNPIDFKGLQRIEKGEYPVAAIREMLLNALVHKNYLGATIQTRVYEDRFSIWNEGALPNGLTIDSLKKVHPSLPRNPIIADVCYKGGFIDSWGRGILKIISACKEADLPEPKIEESFGGLTVTIFKDKFSDEFLKKYNLSDRQLNAIKFVKENVSISNFDYQKINNVGKTTATEDLRKLVELDIFKEPVSKGRGAKYILNK
ncbi:MAG: ATP-binding protein [Ignavibacteria bacterium]|jgi:ATP-dependent DNA helicase RecG